MNIVFNKTRYDNHRQDRLSNRPRLEKIRIITVSEENVIRRMLVKCQTQRTVVIQRRGQMQRIYMVLPYLLTFIELVAFVEF